MKKRGGRKVKIDADLDEDFENYEPSESDDGFDENEHQLLENAVGRKKKKGEEEVLKVYSSSEDSDEDENEEDNEEDVSDEEDEKALYGGGVGSDMDSDIEGQEKADGLPDSKAWGSDKKQYYDTDYVDKDYLGFDDEEAAFEEEKEADAIQRRLMSHLEGTDFTLGLLDSVENKKKQATKKREEPEVVGDEEVVEVDLSKLSTEERLELVKRKSPEMFPIIEQCKARVAYLRDIVLPVLQLVDSGKLKKSKIIQFMETMHSLILNYTVAVLFYLHLKEIGKRTSDHPVFKRLQGLNLLLKEMDMLRKIVDPQIDILLEKVENGEEIVNEEEAPEEPPPKNRKEHRKRKRLELLLKKEEEELVEIKKQKLLKLHEANFEEVLEMRSKKVKAPAAPVVYSEEEEENDDDIDNDSDVDEARNVHSKRGVTFEILKNKGLTPRRKKENRNPRVKNRNKFKKALVRRKGQVREARKEINKYGGELSGIKAHVRKSIKLN